MFFLFCFIHKDISLYVNYKQFFKSY